MGLRHIHSGAWEVEHFFTECCGIYRHDPIMQCNGRYRCVPIGPAADFIDWADLSKLSGYKDHPLCVVDDFGDLQKVPA